MHKLQTELATRLAAASRQVQEGAYYYHYKHPTKLYKVICLAITEADDEVCVVYEAQYGERITFTRSLQSWLETVQWNERRVNRFTLTTATEQ